MLPAVILFLASSSHVHGSHQKPGFKFVTSFFLDIAPIYDPLRSIHAHARDALLLLLYFTSTDPHYYFNITSTRTRESHLPRLFTPGTRWQYERQTRLLQFPCQAASDPLQSRILAHHLLDAPRPSVEDSQQGSARGTSHSQVFRSVEIRVLYSLIEWMGIQASASIGTRFLGVLSRMLFAWFAPSHAIDEESQDQFGKDTASCGRRAEFLRH